MCDIGMYCHAYRLTLTVHINRVVVEMGSSLLLRITHAILPLASQCAIAVIRWKQTLLLAACVCLRGSEYSGVNFNIYCTWAPLSPADNASGKHSFSAFPSQPGFLSFFSCRTKQRPTTRATSTPGSSKPWRPRRTGSDEPVRPHPQEGRESETESGNEIGTGTRHPHLRQLFPH